MAIESAASGFFKVILEHLRPSTRALAAFTLAYLCYWATPSTWPIKQHLNFLLGGYLAVLHAAGVLAVSYLLTYPIEFVGEFLGQLRAQYYTKLYLRDLSPREKWILSNYVANDKRSLRYSITDGDVAMLEANRIIIRLTTLAASGSRFEFSIQPWVFSYLKRRPKLLAGALPNSNQS